MGQVDRERERKEGRTVGVCKENCASFVNLVCGCCSILYKSSLLFVRLQVE